MWLADFTRHLESDTDHTYESPQFTGPSKGPSNHSENVQIGDSNMQNVTINLQVFVENVAESDEEEAKSKLKSLLQNSTIARFVVAVVSVLIRLLT